MSNFSVSHLRTRFTPQEIKDTGVGVRPSVARVLDLIDLNDPAYGKIASVLSDMVNAGIELDEASVAIALKLARLAEPSRADAERVDDAHAGTLGLPMWGKDADQASIVYYIRRGHLVKIGTTINPHARFHDLMPDEVLAFEPGGREIEAFRHEQFSHLRRGNREYFDPDPMLLKHIKRVRSAHGAPDPEWPTTQNIQGRMPSLPKTLDRPESAEVASATEIARNLGINATTVRAWASRGQLQKVAGSRPYRPLYFVDQARQLAERSGAWTKRRKRIMAQKNADL